MLTVKGLQPFLHIVSHFQRLSLIGWLRIVFNTENLL